MASLWFITVLTAGQRSYCVDVVIEPAQSFQTIEGWVMAVLQISGQDRDGEADGTGGRVAWETSAL